MLEKIKRSNFWHKLTHWEYWPMQVFNFPVVMIWLYHGWKARDLFFFSNTNPNLDNGGMMGTSKMQIYDNLPAHLVPTTVLIPKEELTVSRFEQAISSHQLQYPVIIKPDVGERGLLVHKINNKEELNALIRQAPRVDFLVQEYIAFTEEISVLYHRLPGASKGKITSLCIKKPLTITGDGYSTMQELICEYPRAKMQWKNLEIRFAEQLQRILAKGEILVLEPIGNHCRGAMFLNGNRFIDKELESVFDSVHDQSSGIYYGRFDLKCASLEELKKGKEYLILEYNGVASEPAHIYHPGSSLWQAYKDIFEHWDIMLQIHKVLKSRGVPSMGWKEALHYFYTYFSYKRLAG